VTVTDTDKKRAMNYLLTIASREKCAVPQW
jgi:hypothetical protein